MEKVLHCRDVGFDCNGVIKAQTEKEVLTMAAEHARAVHGITEITPEIANKIKAAIKEE
jgi:predicted small metal-binding protein